MWGELILERNIITLDNTSTLPPPSLWGATQVYRGGCMFCFFCFFLTVLFEKWGASRHYPHIQVHLLCRVWWVSCLLPQLFQYHHLGICHLSVNNTGAVTFITTGNVGRGYWVKVQHASSYSQYIITVLVPIIVTGFTTSYNHFIYQIGKFMQVVSKTYSLCG